MIDSIKFNGSGFKHDKLDDVFVPNSKNTIIFCSSPEVKDRIAGIIMDICDGLCEKRGKNVADYSATTEKPKYKIDMIYRPTTRLWVDDEQFITITVEAPFVYTAKSIDDIWFADGRNTQGIAIYPMTSFEGCYKKWAEGIDAVYKYIVSGRYGGYAGYEGEIC